jgi:hypothetical protein
MSKKSVVIALPPRPALDRTAEPHGADGWIHATAVEHPSSRPESIEPAGARAVIDLMAERNWFELVWLVWSFPALATLHWMANATGQPRPR